MNKLRELCLSLNSDLLINVVNDSSGSPYRIIIQSNMPGAVCFEDEKIAKLILEIQKNEKDQ